MQSNSTGKLLVAALLSCSLACALLAPPGSAQTFIPLKPIYQNENDLLSCGGYFIELQNDNLVFFNRRQWDKLKALVDGTIASVEDRFFNYCPETKKQSLGNLTIKADASGRLLFAGVPAAVTSLERLRLTASWTKILKHKWPSGCTITQFAKDKYLIAGGSGPDHRAKPAASIFDVEKDQTEPVGNMSCWRIGDAAILMSNGKVLLVGGAPLNGPSAEIFDPATKRFSAVSGKLAADRHEATMCNAQDGTVLIFGGTNFNQVQPRLPNCPVEFSVERFDPSDESFQYEGQMKYPRHFAHSYSQEGQPKADPRLNYGPIENSASILANGTFIICGGEFQFPVGAELLDLPNKPKQPQQTSAAVQPSPKVTVPAADYDLADSHARDKYFDTIKLMIDNRWKLSGLKLTAGQAEQNDGKSASVKILVLPNGEVKEAAIDKSSSDKSFDAACLNTVLAVAPFPSRKLRYMNVLWIEARFSQSVQLAGWSVSSDNSVPATLKPTPEFLAGEARFLEKYNELVALKPKVLGKSRNTASSSIGGLPPFTRPDSWAIYTHPMDAIDNLGNKKTIIIKVHFKHDKVDQYEVVRAAD